MGSLVFPDAVTKVFLTASAGARAERRHKQLIAKGMAANITDLLRDIEARDARDAERAVAPLRQLPDAQRLAWLTGRTSIEGLEAAGIF